MPFCYVISKGSWLTLSHTKNLVAAQACHCDRKAEVAMDMSHIKEERTTRDLKGISGNRERWHVGVVDQGVNCNHIYQQVSNAQTLHFTLNKEQTSHFFCFHL